MPRKYRQFVARLLLAALLFAQGAISVYACPGSTDSVAPPPAAAEAMPGCDEMTGLDPIVPNLCLAHCQSGDQTFDHSSQHIAAPALLPALVVSLLDPATSQASSRASSSQQLAAARPPPHSILHCCFRI
jgi:hypothetical protein